MAKPEKKLQELKTRLLEVGDLNHINALLGWDQSTYMPPGGAEARGRQSARMAQLAQEKFIDKKIGKLLGAIPFFGKHIIQYNRRIESANELKKVVKTEVEARELRQVQSVIKKHTAI